MATRTYSVNVPETFPDVDSAMTAAMAAEALRSKVVLARDAIGSGAKVLRPTLDDGTMEALCGRAGTNHPSEAIRRLYSTFAERAALPARIPRARVLDVEVVHVSQEPHALLPTGDAVGIPSCYSGSEDRWRREASESQQVFWNMERKMRPASAEPAVKQKAVSASVGRSVLTVLLSVIFWSGIFVGIVYVLARVSAVKASAPGAPGPRFQAWRPQ
jgi:hypothetical protein